MRLRSGSDVLVACGHLLLARAKDPREDGGEEGLETRNPRPLFPAGERSHGSGVLYGVLEALPTFLLPSTPSTLG
jgi:hypothetical protein